MPVVPNKPKVSTPPMDMEKASKVARSKPQILPKLPFGEKGASGFHVVEFLAAGFDQYGFADKFREGKPTPALSIPVRLIDSDVPNLTLGDYQLNLRGMTPEEAEAERINGLTARILTIWEENGRNLAGVTARIEWSDYHNKTFNTATRGYRANVVKGASR